MPLYATGSRFAVAASVQGIDVDRSHQKSDVAVRGRARDVLLWLWGRDGGPVEFLGDERVARRLVSGAGLS